MFPRIPSSNHLFGGARRLVRKPAQLTLGTAAATAVVAAGVVVGLAAGSGPASGSASGVDAIGHARRGAAEAQAVHHGAAHSRHARLTSAASHRTTRGGRQSAAPASHPTAGHTTGRHTTGRHTTGRHTTGRHTTGRHGATQRRTVRHAAAARAGRPYLIYDSVTPSAIPAHHVIATYATGGYAVSPSRVAGRHVLWIDTTGSDHAASVLDVEPGDATPSLAASWAYHRLNADPHALARIYTMRSEWSAVQAAVATLPAKMRSHIRWWIADPTGVPHLVPGSQATQWYWGSNYDITTATPQF